MTRPSLLLDDFLPFRLSFTSNLVSNLIARTYAALFGLTIAEWRVIAVIGESDGITQAVIGSRTRMDKVSVSRATIALVGRGLLARGHNPGDGRSQLLELTASGRDLYAQVAPKALELEQRIFARLDGDEIESFVRMLRRIDAIVLEMEQD